MTDFLAIVGVLVVAIPITTYFSIKLGRGGWLQANYRFYQHYHKKEEN